MCSTSRAPDEDPDFAPPCRSTRGRIGYRTDWKACAINVEQMAREIEDIFQIVRETEPFDREPADAPAFIGIESHGPANSRIEAVDGIEPDSAYAMLCVGLDQRRCFNAATRILEIADMERGM
jgi:hypothetical protein